MSDRAPPLEDQGPVEDRHPRVSICKKPQGPPPKRTRGTRGGRSSQRKRQAYQRYIFLDSQEHGADKFLDPSFVPFICPDGTSRAYKFFTPPDYVDVVTVRSSQVQPPTTPASSSSSRIVVKPAAKKILTQNIPVRLAPRIPKASSSSTPEFQPLGLGKRPPTPPKARGGASACHSEAARVASSLVFQEREGQRCFARCVMSTW